MKKIIQKYFFVVCVVCFTDTYADFWTQKANFPGTGREVPASFSIGNYCYVYGGLGGSYLTDLWQYDVTTNLWTQKADLPAAGRMAASAFSIDGNGYVGCGFGPNEMDDFWEYDTTSNTWTAMANYGGAPRSFAAGFAISNKGYIGTGGASALHSDFWEWDKGTGLWTQKNNFPGIPRAYLPSFVINGKGYIGTGYSNNGWLDELWEYDPVTDQWTQKASLPAPERIDASAFTICGMGFLGTGGEFPYYDDFWMYDPTTNTWSQKANVPGGPRDDCAYFAIGGKGYLGLGQLNGSVYTNDFWEYTPDNICQLVAQFSAPNQLCPGTCTNFTNLSISATSFQWFFPGGNPSSSTDINPAGICYNSPGNFDITLIAINSTDTDTLILYNYITVFPSPPPQSITQIGDTLFSIAGSASYQWYYNGNIIGGATNYSYLATQSGDYNVVATDVNGCEVEAVINNVIASFQFPVSSSQTTLFPNPVTTTIEILGLKNNTADEIEILNVFGEKVFAAVDCKLPITNCQLSSGIYYIKISQQKKIYIAKFVKQ